MATNIEYLTDPVLITLTGSAQDLPAECKAIKPNSGCLIAELYKSGDEATNHAASFAAVPITSDNYTFISCGGSGKFWHSIKGTLGGTLWAYKGY